MLLWRTGPLRLAESPDDLHLSARSELDDGRRLDLHLLRQFAQRQLIRDLDHFDDLFRLLFLLRLDRRRSQLLALLAAQLSLGTLISGVLLLSAAAVRLGIACCRGLCGYPIIDMKPPAPAETERKTISGI